MVASRRSPARSFLDDPSSVAVVHAIERRLRAIEERGALPALERADDQERLHTELLTAALEDLVIELAGRRCALDVPPAQLLGNVYEVLMGGRIVRERSLDAARSERLAIVASHARRSTSTHYTPNAMSRALIQSTLRPLLYANDPSPSSERVLSLRVCDASMGSGALLLETCELLAEHLVDAWAREGTLGDHEDANLDAKRLVAVRCIYGVDRNATAVNLARASMWLFARADGDPFAYLEHSLVHGDALVGLDLAQLRAGHWSPVRASVELPHRTEGERARLFGDVIVGAFFAHDGLREREAELRRRVDLFTTHDERPALDAWAQLRAWQRDARAHVPILHWPLAFPHLVGARDRPEIDAFVGNPPFVDGKRVSSILGDRYSDWITTIHASKKTADLAGHFVRRCFTMLAPSATLGMITTNSISEGETRRVGLQHALANGGVIYDATRSTRWPGDAEVHVSLVCMARGDVASNLGGARLDGRPVARIGSSLEPGTERTDPKKLASNVGLSFHGYKPYGEGFQLTCSERDDLVHRDARNAARIRKYAGGLELNGNPVLSTNRWVIHFGDATLDEARQWPDLLRILEERVRPSRLTADDSDDGRRLKTRWWQFFRERPELQHALRDRTTCLALARVAKHLVIQTPPANWVLDEDVIVFALSGWTAFAVLQSSVHERWARAHSSTFGEGLRYSSSRAFDTFPFPLGAPDASIDELDRLGARLHAERAAYQHDAAVGSTTTYNRLRDPSCDDAHVVALRATHEALDAAVLRAYGVADVVVPPYCADASSEDDAQRAFTERVLDHLHALNAARATPDARRVRSAPPLR